MERLKIPKLQVGVGNIPPYIRRGVIRNYHYLYNTKIGKGSYDGNIILFCFTAYMI